jgi:CBS domain-containing protein
MEIADNLQDKGSRVITMRPDSTIDTVVRCMRLECIGAVIISSDGKSVIGILSERDIVHALAEHGANLLVLNAEDVMTREVVKCSCEDTLQSVMVKMTQQPWHEPTLDDLLNDSTLDKLLARDGVSKEELRRVVEDARDALARVPRSWRDQ